MPNIFVSPQKSKILSKGKDFSFIREFFSAFHFMPKDVRVETQEPGETIVLLLRKHWITNIDWLMISILLILSPVFLFPMLGITEILPKNFSPSLITFLILVWYLFTFSYLLVNFLLWYFTVSIVTNERVVDIDFVNILHKKFAETRISRIEDVTMKTGGFVRAFFDFGDVFVQTAAKEAMFQFYAVPHPEKVVRIINNLMEKSEIEGGKIDA